ncbi:hypothetical protein [Sporolactobacillus inulinus]|jgi:hypothetical protein|uniref:Uncharacterized protein n=1 Tax=Sporolactobacillus inulinus TaxID=2078 RepID=A0A4Y3T6J6_9BACL|nr:hypothetical protein [Sporolactobacillus inulinus]GAY75859.1 hypothetical protein NBRC111894_1413 [Sporolactobacillus inulinus]GEB76540.1 hypothetical protein SIN01_08850 [Sporolactobacillus inulinus]
MDDERLKAIETKLSAIEKELHELNEAKQRPFVDPNTVWALIPIAAIIMWGLQGLF